MAAIYLDGGMEAAEKFIQAYIGPEIELAAARRVGRQLQIAAAAVRPTRARRHADVPLARRKRSRPQQVLQDRRPRSAKRRFPPAWGRSKKEAEQRAAHNAIADLREEPIPFPSDDAAEAAG